MEACGAHDVLEETMKKILQLVLLFALLVGARIASAQAIGALPINYCNQAGKQAQTNGLLSSNYMQGIIPRCTVTVYLTGSTTLATIYSDANRTVLTNPFNANSNGQFTIFASSSQGYDVQGSGGNGNPNCTTGPTCYSAPTALAVDIYPSSNLTPITGVVALSGDGSLISNMNSTGNVTLALTNAAGYKVWGNCSSPTGVPSYCSLVYAMFPNSGATPCTYTNPTVSVNQQGVITSISNGGGSTSFSSISTGTNTTAAMTCGAGCIVNFTSTGVVNANQVNGAAPPTSTLFGGWNGSKQAVAATTSNLATFLAGLTGCGTAGNAYVPADSQCEAVGGAGVTWPASGDVVISNATNTPTGLPPQLNLCLGGTVGPVFSDIPCVSSLTTTGSSGASSFNTSTGVLNIPIYTGGGGGSGGGALTNITGSSQITASGCVQSSSVGGTCAVSGSSTSVVTLSVIPGTYSALTIVAYGTDTVGLQVPVDLTINGDTGSNYSINGIYQNGSNAPTANANISEPNCEAMLLSSTGISAATFYILGYANTAFPKSISVPNVAVTNTASVTDNRVSQYGCAWNNTAAITSVTFTMTSGDFSSGMVFAIYGSDGPGGGGGGGGTVTSVAMTVPPWLTVGGSPITSSGTLAVTATAGETANEFLATPNGSSGTVGLRSIAAADVPTLNQNTTGTSGGLSGTPSISVNNLTSSGTPTLTGIEGAGTYCLQISPAGILSNTGAACGSGGGAVNSVTNSDGTLTISPPTGSVVASLALGHPNTWTGNQTSAKWIASTGFDISGATTAGHYLRNNGIDYVDGTIQAGDVPTLNQSTTGNAANVTGTVAIVNGGTNATTAAAGTMPNATSGTAASWTSTPTLGASGTLGSLTLGNASSGTVTVEPVPGALGTATASVPGNTGTIAELNLAQTFSAVQTISPVNGLKLSAMSGTSCIEEVSGVITATGSACGSSSGSVTSVALALPSSTFSISGSPVTSSGTLTGAFVNQSSNTFLRGPNSGSAAIPSWGGLVSADIPSNAANTSGQAGSVSNALTMNNSGSGAASGTTYNGSSAVVMSYNTLGAAPALPPCSIQSSTFTPANSTCYFVTASVSTATPAASAFVIFSVTTSSAGSFALTGTTIADGGNCSTYISGTTLTLPASQSMSVKSDGTTIRATCTAQTFATISTSSNCSSSASPAVCGAAPAGSVALPTNAISSSVVVNTTAVTANSQIILTTDDTLGTKLGVTCNSTVATLVGGLTISGRTPGTSFTIANNVAVVTNPLCVSYIIVN
jgi:hypothetical protein